VTLEGHSFIIDLARLSKRENLEPTRIGKHGVRPAHEPVQTTQPSHYIIARTQVQMIRVREYERGAQFLELGRRERLDRCLRADGREDWCKQVAVGSSENAGAGAVIFSCDIEFKHAENYNGRDKGLY